MNKNIVLMGLVLVLAACSDEGKKVPRSGAVAEPIVAEVVAEVAVEPEVVALTEGNEADIRNDLLAVNLVVSEFNAQSVAYRKALRENRWAQEPALEIMAQVKAATAKMNEDLTSLACKSKEVDDVRLAMIEGNVLSLQLLDLTAEAERSEEDVAQMALISKQAIALQQATGQTLDKLNAAHQP